MGTSSYTFHAGFSFLLGVSLMHPMLFFLLFFFFFFFFAFFFFLIWGVSLKHLMMASFLCGEFLLHILC